MLHPPLLPGGLEGLGPRACHRISLGTSRQSTQAVTLAVVVTGSAGRLASISETSAIAQITAAV